MHFIMLKNDPNGASHHCVSVSLRHRRSHVTHVHIVLVLGAVTVTVEPLSVVLIHSCTSAVQRLRTAVPGREPVSGDWG